MKIGIVTYFNIKNFGSSLQAYSLKTILNGLGYDVVFLNVREHKFINKILHKLYVAIITIGKSLIYKSARDTNKEIRKLRKNSESSLTKESINLFDLFLKENLPYVNIDRISLKRIAKSDEYIAFICGSDQIWSPLSLHLPGYKYLYFAPPQKKIAYAPSFGVGMIPDYNKKNVKKKLSNFNSISVREIQGSIIIKDLIGKNVPVLLDPTMLIDGEEWRKLYKKNTIQKEIGKYALCYFFDEPSQTIVEQILDYTSKKNLKIVILTKNNFKFIKSGAKYYDAGPWEFLQFVDCAECVFTNSFHGSIFSILFKKPLKVFGRDHSNTVNQTSRIDTLLETAGLQNCRYNGKFNEIVPQSTRSTSNEIVQQREKSINFLKEQISRREKNE